MWVLPPIADDHPALLLVWPFTLFFLFVIAITKSQKYWELSHGTRVKDFSHHPRIDSTFWEASCARPLACALLQAYCVKLTLGSVSNPVNRLLLEMERVEGGGCVMEHGVGNQLTNTECTEHSSRSLKVSLLPFYAWVNQPKRMWYRSRCFTQNTGGKLRKSAEVPHHVSPG